MSTAWRCRCADLVESDNRSAAFVIACYSDPGLHVCREATDRPVFGIAECGVLTALTRAETFGVIAIAQRSIRRHVRYLRQMGLMDRLAGERPLNMSVAETASGEGTLAKMIEVGRALKEQDGAGAIVMGCAGMARHRKPLEAGARYSRDRSDAGGHRDGAWHGAAFAELAFARTVRLATFGHNTRGPLRMALAVHRKRLALIGIEIAEQAPDRPVSSRNRHTCFPCRADPRARGRAGLRRPEVRGRDRRPAKRCACIPARTAPPPGAAP